MARPPTFRWSAVAFVAIVLVVVVAASALLVLLDPRVRRQRYGQTFLQSLPPYRMTTSITDVERFFVPGASH